MVPCRVRGNCQFCDESFIAGEDISPGPDGWLCLSCTESRRDIDRIADRFSFYLLASRQPPPLMALDIDVLKAALTSSFTVPAEPGAAEVPLHIFVDQRLRLATVALIEQALFEHRDFRITLDCSTEWVSGCCVASSGASQGC